MSSNHSQHPLIIRNTRLRLQHVSLIDSGFGQNAALGPLKLRAPRYCKKAITKSHAHSTMAPWVRSTKPFYNLVILSAGITQLEKRLQGYVQYRSEADERMMFAYSTKNGLLVLRQTLLANNHPLKTLQIGRLNPLFVCLPPLSCPTSSPPHCLLV